MKFRKLTLSAAALGMLLLILDSKAAAASAYQGISLCLEVVIPSLFPFFLLSGVLVRSLQDSPMLRPLERVMGVPSGSGCYVLTGFLGGYPIGAQASAEAHRRGNISLSQANRLLAFCSQAGPSFLFGMAAAQFPHRGCGWALWGLQLLCAWATALLMPRPDSTPVKPRASSALSLPEAMTASIKAMAGVCGWVILFRVILGFLQRWMLWVLPEAAQILLCGILELSNGCLGLSAVQDVGIRFVLSAVMLNFGGVCVAMQTAGVAKGLDMGWYWRGKLIQTCLAFSFSAALAGYPLALVIPAGMFGRIWLHNSRKSSSIRVAVGV